MIWYKVTKMNKERMIRIPSSAGNKKVEYRIEVGDSRSPLGADVYEETVTMYDLEVVPPKGWVPYCYDGSICIGPSGVDNDNACKECPFKSQTTVKTDNREK